MNKVILQLWEESDKKLGMTPNGCTLHLTIDDKIKFISYFYSDRKEEQVPDSYEKTIGDSTEVFITDFFYDMVKDQKNIRLNQNELNNLIIFEDIIIKK